MKKLNDFTPGLLVRLEPSTVKQFGLVEYKNVIGEVLGQDIHDYVCVWWPVLNRINYWTTEDLTDWNSK